MTDRYQARLRREQIALSGRLKRARDATRGGDEVSEQTGVPINGTGHLLEKVQCRTCGAWGLEDASIDPAPGLCPACFEKELLSGDWFTVEQEDGR